MTKTRVPATFAWLILVTVCALGLAGAHSPPARALIGRQAVSWLETRGLRVSFDALSYNLFTLRFHLRGVRVSASHASTPFLIADDIQVDLPWAALFSGIRTEEVTLTRPTLTVATEADGSLNLPTGTPGAAPLARLDLGHIQVTHATVRYDDAAGKRHVAAEDLSFDLMPDGRTSTGHILVARGLSLQTPGLSTHGTLDGSLAYDGVTLSLDRLVYASDLGRLRLDGRAGLFGAPASLALRMESTLALGPLSAALTAGAPVTGTLGLTGQISGSMDSPEISLELESSELRWTTVAARALTAHLNATTRTLTVKSATVRLGSGLVEGRGQLDFDTLKATSQVSWRDIPLSALADAGQQALRDTRLSGHATLTATLAGAPTLAVDATVRADLQPHTAVTGTVALAASDHTWRAHTAITLDGATIDAAAHGEVAEASLTNSTLRGAIAASADDLARLASTAGRMGFWPRAWPTPDAGRLRADLQLAGTLASPVVTGSLGLTDAHVPGADALSARLNLRANTGLIAIDDLTATMGGNTLSGRAAMGLPRRTLEGSVDIVVGNVAALGPTAADWRPTGRLTGHADLAGTLTAPTATITLAGDDLGIAGQTLGNLSATALASQSSLALTRAEIRQPTGGRVTATGEYSLTGDRHGLALQAESFRLSPISTAAGDWPLSTVLDGALDLHGTPEHPEGGGQIRVADLRWGDAHVDAIRADIRVADDAVTVTAEAPALALTARAAIAPRAPYAMTVTAEGTPDVAAVIASLGWSLPPQLHGLSGVVRGRVTATGEAGAPSEMAGDLTLEAFDLRTDETALALEQPAVARYAAGRLAVESLRVRTGTTTAEISGNLGATAGDALSLQVKGNLADLHTWMVAAGAPAAFGLDGAFTLDAHASGTLDAPVLGGTVQVTAGRGSWPGYPEATALTATATLEHGVVDVPVLEAHWQGAVLAGQARMPLRFLDAWLPARVIPAAGVTDGAASARVTLDTVTPAVLEPFLDPVRLSKLTGGAALRIDLQADRPALDHLNGSLVMSEFSLNSDGVPVEQTRPTRLELESGILRAADWHWALAGSPLQLTGTAGLRPADPVDLQVDGAISLRLLSLFLPDAATEGTGDLSLTIKGTVGTPVADGVLRLRDGELLLSEPRLGLSGVAGAIMLRPDRIEIEQLAGTVNGGRVSMHGALGYKDLRVTDGAFTLDATHVALDVPTGMRSEVNAALTLALGGRAKLSGRLDVLQGAYREPLSLAAAIASFGRQQDAVAVDATASPTLDAIDLDVAVTSAEDLAVDNNYGRLDLGLDLRLVGTAASPAVVGRAAVREGGVLFLGGRTYVIDRGVIDFSDPHAIVPQLDISGRTRVDGTNDAGSPTQYDITLTVTGTPDTLTTTLTSTPDRPQADIVSLLATGRLADQIGGAGASVARDQFLGYLSGETLGFAAKAIGMDSIRFERGANQDALASDASLAGEVNPAQRLTIARRISGAAQVTVSQNLRDTGRLTWIVAVTPTRAVEVRAISRDDTSRSYEVRHDVSFGGPAAPPTTRQEQPGRISAIRFTGEPVLAVAALTRRLHLHAGDRFDFYRWQQDRSRLRQLYLDLGYREVKVSARQTREQGPDVALDYNIAAGARTAIEITGERLSAQLVQQIDRIWSNALLEIGLLTDVTSAVRTALADEGYLRARVRVTRVAPDATSALARLRVAVARGPRSATRTLAVTGNTHITTAEVHDAADTLGVGAWMKPASLADALTQMYRQRGFLAATVSAGPVTYSTSAATLPVTVREGEPFSIGQIAIVGTQARTDARARQDLGLTEGARYTAETIPPARQRLLRAYAAEGFNAVQAEVRTTVHVATATVDVTVQMQEGVQQILEAVTVMGDTGVHDGVVTDALQLTPGAPANLDAFYAGRRRLFQTGLFSRADVTAVPTGAPQTAPGIEAVRAEVTLLPVQPWRIRYGVNVTDESAPVADQGRTFGGGLSGTLDRTGLFGRPGSSLLSVRYNNDQRVIRGSVSWPRLFGRALSSRLYVSRSRDSVNGAQILSFITDRTTLTAEQRFHIGGRVQVSYSYQFERNHVFDPNANPADPFALNERWRQARLASSVVFDTRNDALEPVRGTLHSSTVEYGLEALGRAGRFVKYSLQQFLFVRPVPRVVSASAVRLNVGKGFGQSLILSERFLAGGANTVRGYAENALAGFDIFGDPIPGQASIVLNQEFRFPVLGRVGGVTFIDAGNVYPRVADLSLASLQVGAGAGLRLRTPVGLFRLDVAAPVPRQNRAVRYSVAFGHVF